MGQSSFMKVMSLASKGLVVVGRATVKGAAVGARALATTAKKHEAEIAWAGKTAIKGVAATVRATGSVLDAAGNAVAGQLSEHTQKSGQGVRAAAAVLKVTAKTVSLTGKGVRYAGQGIDAAAPAVGGTVGGVMTGATQTLSGVIDSAAISESDILALQRKLRAQGRLSTQRSAALNARIQQLQQSRRKSELLDLLTIGGLSLACAARNPAQVPEDIEKAFAAAYPGLASIGESFGDAAARMSSSELPGLVNGVKGKLFELQLVEQLNNGQLPPGYEARLAGSVTQPGHDIVVTDESWVIDHVLSAKATDSAAYVQAALEKYPDIQITTTSEVHAQLMSIGMADGVIDSGISNAALQSAVEQAAMGDEGALQALAPSTVGLAVIALSAFMDQSVSLEARGADFGQRTAKVGLASAAAKGAMAASGFWWLGLAAGVGSGWLAGFGERKRLRYEAVKACSQSMDDLARRQRTLARNTASALR